ncbi:NADH dehydrogenase [ubiquinone] 1 alpha subcomplex assembly factor 4 isoform X1 [Cotesia typhae]|uniref:NADH dehydrogenase [ubiquinone] 1 alpha subcomplex assembly factor 4 isoform X1 n=1 Tax=Cotesia typhae TaxID=2053667 RepID=UPI003D6914E2
MSKIMGVIMSRLSKPARAFNIENRAAKILEREKPIPAPPHPSTAQQLKISREVDPNFLENHYKKDEELYGRLKQVFVSSHIVHKISDQESEAKKPKNKKWSQDFEYGFWEPEKIPEGRCQLKTAMQFMADYQADSKKNSIESIAMKYKLNPADVKNIIKYYRVFQVVQPQDSKMYVPREDTKPLIEEK